MTPETVELHAPDDLPDATAVAVRERMASLQRFTDKPLRSARLTLRRPQTHASRSRWVADASILLDGRLLAAHATGPSAMAAADEVVERLRRQIRRAVGAEIATRNEPRTIARALRDLRHELGHRPSAEVLPTRPGDRRLVHRIARPRCPSPSPTPPPTSSTATGSSGCSSSRTPASGCSCTAATTTASASCTRPGCRCPTSSRTSWSSSRCAFPTR